jgi:ATP-dependent helicase/DNAse subunit B
LLIADYKSSLKNLPKSKEVMEGTAFQVPLYLLAAGILLEKIYGIISEPQGGVYYSLKPIMKKGAEKSETARHILASFDSTLTHFLGKSASASKLGPETDINDILNDSVQYAKKIIWNIADGNFPVEPVDSKNCQYCSYSNICRIKEKKPSIIAAEIEETEE